MASPRLLDRCGICKEIIDEIDVAAHECLKGYEELRFNKDTRFLYPVTKQAQQNEATTQWYGAMDQISQGVTVLAKSPLPMSLPPDRELDDVDGLLLILKSWLRSVPEEKRRSLMIDIVRFVRNAIDNLD